MYLWRGRGHRRDKGCPLARGGNGRETSASQCFPLVPPLPNSIHSHHAFVALSPYHMLTLPPTLPDRTWKSLAGRRGRSGGVILGLCQQVGERLGLGLPFQARIWGASS